MAENLMLEKEIKIYPPILIIESDVYNLIIRDQTGKYHYFNNDGSYDGYHIDCYYSEN